MTRNRARLRNAAQPALLVISVVSFVVAVGCAVVGIWAPEYTYDTTNFSDPVWVYGNDQRWEGTAIVFFLVSLVTGLLYFGNRDRD